MQGNESLQARGAAADEAMAFARSVTTRVAEQEIIARNLAHMPDDIRVRGLFFEGLIRVVEQRRGVDAVALLLGRAGIEGKRSAFGAYPQREFYRLQYLAAPLLFPGEPFTTALRSVARTYFPIFKESLLGRTMSALMGDRPATILPVLARAYNACVEGNEHHARADAAAREVTWRCTVEPAEWFIDVFSGIVEGAMPAGVDTSITVVERHPGVDRTRYVLSIKW